MEATAPQEEILFEPVDLSGKSREERAQMGRNVDALLKHPGFADLLAAISSHGDLKLTARMFRPPDPNAAAYADLTGYLRGLSRFEQIAWGVVVDGKEAERESREAEERG